MPLTAAVLFALAGAPAFAAAPAAKPDVILISVDDLRAARVTPELMPNLSRFAARALVFEQAVTAATWTLPSHASMLTGLLPDRHGAGGQTTRPRPLKAGVPSVAGW